MPKARDSLRFLNVSELAEVTGFAPATISKRLNALGLKARIAKGNVKRFDARAAIRALFDPAALDPRRQAARLDAARADLAELDLARKRRELIPAEDLDRALIALASAVAVRMDAIPPVLALEIASESSPAVCQSLIQKALDSARADLAAAGVAAHARAAELAKTAASIRRAGGGPDAEAVSHSW